MCSLVLIDLCLLWDELSCTWVISVILIHTVHQIYSSSAGSYSNQRGSQRAAQCVTQSSWQLFFLFFFLFSVAMCACLCMSMCQYFVFSLYSVFDRGSVCPPHNFLSFRISGAETPPSRSAVIFFTGVRFGFSEVVGLCQDCRCQWPLLDVAP